MSPNSAARDSSSRGFPTVRIGLAPRLRRSPAFFATVLLMLCCCLFGRLVVTRVLYVSMCCYCCVRPSSALFCSVCVIICVLLLFIWLFVVQLLRCVQMWALWKRPRHRDRCCSTYCTFKRLMSNILSPRAFCFLISRSGPLVQCLMLFSCRYELYHSIVQYNIVLYSKVYNIVLYQ